VGDRVETFSRGEIVLLPPNISHGWYFDEYDHDEEGKIENITIIFSSELLDKCDSAFPEIKACISQIKKYSQAVTFQGKSLQSLQKIMTAMSLQNNIEQLSSLIKIFQIIASTAETRVVGFLTKPNKSAIKMQEISRYIVHNYQKKITLDTVAEYFGMNRSLFCSFFKREKGKSFFAALNEYRIECSCLMLRQTTMSIAEICFAVGFNDVPYFNRTFKKVKGITPKFYRENQ
jgi:YesN/AraC family two-component response regulator